MKLASNESFDMPDLERSGATENVVVRRNFLKKFGRRVRI